MRKATFIITLFLMASIIMLVPSCKKDDQKCENWEFQDVCTAKTVTANCYEYVHRVSNICYAELQDAHEGKTSLIHEDSNIIIERHYIRQVR